MQYSLLSLAFAALALASPAPQGVTSAVAPSSTAPAGCSSSYNGQFEIELVNVTKSSKRDLAKRAALVVTLSNGVLTDSQGRTGYIAANYQFQFDKPPQTGAIYTAGFSACSNGSLAIGNDAIFYECLSGTFYNIYDESVGAQCAPVYIDIIAVGSGSAPASVISDGQVTGTPVSQISDGQPQATGAVSQISDGQVQGPTGNPVTQISDGQPQGPTGAPVTQISDGQVQGPTGHPVTQISDGQIQGPTATAVVSPVSQISDGQPQAPVATGTGKPMPSGNSTSPSTPSTAPVTPSGNSATGMSALGGAAFAFVAMLAAAAFL